MDSEAGEARSVDVFTGEHDMLLVFVMGPTCAGKSTLFDYVRKHAPHIGLVEVGKMFRAKYPPSYFQGQAAPAHTREEAWQMCEGAIREHAAAGKLHVLVDGQPRSIDQVEACFTKLADFPRKLFVYLDPGLEERTRRLVGRFKLPEEQEAFELGRQRLTNDISTYEVVLAELARRTQEVHTFDTLGWGDTAHSMFVWRLESTPPY